MSRWTHWFGVCRSGPSRITIAMKHCPKCRLVNLESASLCDCGYDFVSDTVKPPSSPVGKRPLARNTSGMLRFWLRSFSIGTGVGLVCYFPVLLLPRGWWILPVFVICPSFGLLAIDAVSSSKAVAMVLAGISILANGLVYMIASTIIFLLRGGIVNSE